jgi:predicted O-methyltransferase YrrM
MGVRTFPTSSPEPLAHEITFGAFSNPLMKAILKEFGRDAFARCSACMEFEDFVKRILRGRRFGTCLEIGTFHGVTAILLSQYFDKVVCVSVDDDPKKLMKWDIVDFLGITNIEFHDVANNAQKHAIVKELSFDFVYSDGDHVHDCRSDWELVERCGRILQHEAWPLQSIVWNKIHEMPDEEVTWAQFDCLAYWERSDGNMARGNG